MNPPSALFGAMNRERKPFTYTPGGLDLSEIKSERMAKRLMRNAMNQGVPEVPVQNIQSPPANHVAVPNFNCMPVQVFPTLNLPANPKSLLRTRSNPEHPREPPVQRVPPPSHFNANNNIKPNGGDNIGRVPFQPEISNQNRPTYDCSNVSNNANILPKINYGSDGFTAAASTLPSLPEISYEAEYFQAPPRYNTINNKEIIEPRNIETVITIPSRFEDENVESLKENQGTLNSDFVIEPIAQSLSPLPTSESAVTKQFEDEAATDEQTVKVVKKQVKKEKKVENGDQNGDASAEADLTVKLPTKKSAAKTETKVEVQRTILPDGSAEEVKITTTKTTIDGKTEIRTKTEKTIIPKEETEEVEEEEEEEQEEANEVVVQEAEEEVVEEPTVVVVKKSVVKETPVVENGAKETVTKTEERTEKSTTKKVVVVQNDESEEEEEETVVENKTEVVKEEVVEEAEPETKTETVKEVVKEIETEEVEEEEAEEEEVKVVAPTPKSEPEQTQEDEEEEEEEEEQVVTKQEVVEVQKKEEKEIVVESKKQDEEESEYTEEEYESEKEEVSKPPAKEPAKPQEPEKEPEEETPVAEPKAEESEPTEKPAPAAAPQEPEPQKAPLREPSIPLEKVEDVEIKPIGSGLISKSHTENTEIITNSTQPTGPLSTQTEYNRVENIVTVNRTTKTLDHSYDQITQAGIPTLRTYFAPSRERIGASPQPSKPYQPVYAPSTPDNTTERRHSLLLDRLSVDRQLPTSDIYQNTYQYNNQSYEQQRQWSQEPQSEVVNVSNVKPSKITNQQWYQQNNRDNVIYNNVTPTGAPASQPWSQPAPQQPQQQYQPSYTENITQERSATNTYQQNNYPTYVPQANNWVGSNVDNVSSFNTNKYSLGQDTTESYQKSTSTQQYSSSYVPPPWEQDSNYVLNTSNQNYYQPPPQTNTYEPSPNQGWNPAPPSARFTKPPPTSYIPPAPNQSFVKTVNAVEPPKIPGRKTYYSEYERRYITVPESTYIPPPTKFQAQPDPSPQYYYDNNEPSEKVEHEWRKELREFTEKTSQTTQQTTQTTSVNPPWEEDPKYEKTPSAYIPTPTWSQTLRPRSCRERSFESEYVGSQEYAKTNTLGRGRPLSTYATTEAPIPERPRGVSVDRYNPNNYQSPLMSEHGPVPTHTLAPTPPAKSYHNPNVPAYHAHPRASAEPREQPATFQQTRLWNDSRGTPVQSRSFKYLQWITGTED